jgi:hypothetical protein
MREYFAPALGKCDRDVGIMSAPDDERRQVKWPKRGRHLTRGFIDFACIAIKFQYSAPGPAIKGSEDVVEVFGW